MTSKLTGEGGVAVAVKKNPIDILNFKQRLLSLDMKTNVVQHFPRIKFSNFHIFLDPSFCLTLFVILLTLTGHFFIWEPAIRLSLSQAVQESQTKLKVGDPSVKSWDRTVFAQASGLTCGVHKHSPGLTCELHM